jgi:hypothetical protein
VMFSSCDYGAFLFFIAGSGVWEWEVAMASMANQAAHASGLRGCAVIAPSSSGGKKMTNVCMTPLLSASSTFYSSRRLQSCALSKARRSSSAARSALEAPKAAKEPVKIAKEKKVKAAPEAEKEVVETVQKAPEAATATVEAVVESVKEAPEAAKETVAAVKEKAPEVVKEKAPEVVKETVEAVTESVKEAVGATTEAVQEVTKAPELKRQLTRTRSFHHPRGGHIKADPLRVIMFQVQNQTPMVFFC